MAERRGVRRTDAASDQDFVVLLQRQCVVGMRAGQKAIANHRRGQRSMALAPLIGNRLTNSRAGIYAAANIPQYMFPNSLTPLMLVTSCPML
jgi:hypothetical protein